MKLKINLKIANGSPPRPRLEKGSTLTSFPLFQSHNGHFLRRIDVKSYCLQAIIGHLWLRLGVKALHKDLSSLAFWKLHCQLIERKKRNNKKVSSSSQAL